MLNTITSNSSIDNWNAWIGSITSNIIVRIFPEDINIQRSVVNLTRFITINSNMSRAFTILIIVFALFESVNFGNSFSKENFHFFKLLD